MAKVEKKRGLSEDRLRDFLREMLLIRRFEEKGEERFRAGRFRTVNYQPMQSRAQRKPMNGNGLQFHPRARQ